MHIFLWIVQIGLALHTAVGAFWKFSNAGALAPLFPIFPMWLWTMISVLELVAAALLIIPLAKKSLGKYAVWGAALVAFEMFAFTAIYLFSGTANYTPTYYWIVVLVVAGFVSYARSKIAPITASE